MKKLFLILLVPLVLACGVSVPTPKTTVDAVQKGATQTAIPTLTEFAVTTKQVIVTADVLTIRPQPSTVGTLGYKYKGDIIVVGIMIDNNNPDCQHWYPMQAPNGWVCADFVEEK